jgi:hypothetical protein
MLDRDSTSQKSQKETRTKYTQDAIFDAPNKQTFAGIPYSDINIDQDSNQNISLIELSAIEPDIKNMIFDSVSKNNSNRSSNKSFQIKKKEKRKFGGEEENNKLN